MPATPTPPAMTEVAKVPETEVPTKVESTGAIIDQDRLEDENSPYPISSSLNFTHILFGLVIFAVPSAAFIYFGGIQWAKRVIRGEGKGKYRVVGERDLEK